jgi:hypothetical protein
MLHIIVGAGRQSLSYSVKKDVEQWTLATDGGDDRILEADIVRIVTDGQPQMNRSGLCFPAL